MAPANYYIMEGGGMGGWGSGSPLFDMAKIPQANLLDAWVKASSTSDFFASMPDEIISVFFIARMLLLLLSLIIPITLQRHVITTKAVV